MADVLNGRGAFLEFEPYGGGAQLHRQGAGRLHQAAGRAEAAEPQRARCSDLDGFDPFAVLGIQPGATREDIRQAYFALAKAYHPDRYATAELPTEVIEYLFAMARRINAAHAALNVEQKKQAAAGRRAGVHLAGARASFTHRGRWAKPTGARPPAGARAWRSCCSLS